MAGLAVAWDYSKLAQTYASRPDYAPAAIDALVAVARLAPGAAVCDVGAGSGHLTLPLLERGLAVDAVEPNLEMRNVGIAHTAGQRRVAWFEGTGERTGRPAGSFDLVTFGSSFNVVDRAGALAETARLLKPRGWFACMWNHRDLDDALQADVEAAIRANVPGYSYGTRREDQAPVIRASGLFERPVVIEAPVLHEVSAEAWIDAWRSHATLARQAGGAFDATIDAIAHVVRRRDQATLVVPYTTRVWLARRTG